MSDNMTHDIQWKRRNLGPNSQLLNLQAESNNLVS